VPETRLGLGLRKPASSDVILRREIARGKSPDQVLDIGRGPTADLYLSLGSPQAADPSESNVLRGRMDGKCIVIPNIFDVHDKMAPGS